VNLVAGLTTILVVIPQSMVYATIAGLPVVKCHFDTAMDIIAQYAAITEGRLLG